MSICPLESNRTFHSQPEISRDPTCPIQHNVHSSLGDCAALLPTTPRPSSPGGPSKTEAGPQRESTSPPAVFVERLFSANDSDGDGKVTPDEARPVLKNNFDEFDQNSDGVVDRKEFKETARRFIRIRPPSSDSTRRTGPTIDAARLARLKDRYWPERPRAGWPIVDDALAAEELPGDGIWLDPALASISREYFPVTVWFDRQFLGDGAAFKRRCQEFTGQLRGELRSQVIETLKSLSEESYRAAEEPMRRLADGGQIQLVEWHWIVNGFSCWTTKEGLSGLQRVPGVKKVFLVRGSLPTPTSDDRQPPFLPSQEKDSFDPERFQHPWYTRYLQADKVWQRLGVTGKGTLNVVMDGNFVFAPSVTANLYRNMSEVPGNGKDDDGNGLVDDYHGFNFLRDDGLLTVRSDESMGNHHGFICTAIICGTGSENSEYEFGLAPEASWAGVIASGRVEAAAEWSIEHGADTLSMSFSAPNLGEYRSHWRKVMEQAAFCGVCGVSGAGNFAREGSRSYAPVPVQLRTPEDIPEAVFAPAGVQRNLQRTVFSSQGPVKWETEHYRDGEVQKPDFCAFNSGLPRLLPGGDVQPASLDGNSFAGPMVAGTLSLMFSADPDLLPWDAREILAATTTDVGPPGIDHQTGDGLVNCYRAVREVLRRKCIREGDDATPYEGRQADDALDPSAVHEGPVFE